MIMILCIGTAQFGMAYGIRRQGRPACADCIAMLDYATQNGVTGIDTATAYGNAEEIVGTFIKQNTISREKIELISKLPPNLLDRVTPKEYGNAIKRALVSSLKALGTEYLDAYLLHNAQYVSNDDVLEAFAKCEQEGMVRKAGVSVYTVEEALAGVESPYVNVLQLPYSIFDRRMEDGGIFTAAQKANTTVDIRSVFVQGLILMQEQEIPAFLSDVRTVLHRLDTLCMQHGYSRVQVALQFVKSMSMLNRLVLGVDGLEQLKECITAFHQSIPLDDMKHISSEFSHLDANIISPNLWQKD